MVGEFQQTGKNSASLPILRRGRRLVRRDYRSGVSVSLQEGWLISVEKAALRQIARCVGVRLEIMYEISRFRGLVPGAANGDR